MAGFALPKDFLKDLDFIEGETAEKKVINLVNGNITLKLKECEDEIIKYESKYGMTFSQFETAWKKGKIPKKHSYDVERDYMEWEGFESEKKHWLSMIKSLKEKSSFKR